MQLFNPSLNNLPYRDNSTRDLMAKVIEFFETKGLKKLKEDFHNATWNYDFVQFMKEHQVMAKLMTPSGYGAEGSCWDSFQNKCFSEITGFYGLTYWYTFQVSMLGLGPIFLGSNEALKHKTAKLLQQGHVFAFGLSEKEHGADIYSSEMTLSKQADGSYLANGSKYYIGNGNEAAIVSTFGKMADTGEYVFFAVDSKHPNYHLVKNTVRDAKYVAEYRLDDYPITGEDIMEIGPKAWDNMLNTINFCKFNLGTGAIGLAEHAFHEAINHTANRYIYGHYVTDFPHVKSMLTDIYSRICAMKLFNARATDYMRAASSDDRRYLLFNPMVKMKVTTQGEVAVKDLLDIVAAKGFEAEPFFEVAVREMLSLPRLEGTAHVNMALIIKFMKNYLFAPGKFPQVDRLDALSNDDFLFDQGPTKGLGNITFHDHVPVFDSASYLPNVEVFQKQIAAFKAFFLKATPSKEQSKDLDYLLAAGECFSSIVYGHLILEGMVLEQTDEAVVDRIFNVLIRDMSHYALTFSQKASNTELQREMLLKVIQSPVADSVKDEHLWNSYIYKMKGQYAMNVEPAKSVGETALA